MRKTKGKMVTLLIVLLLVLGSVAVNAASWPVLKKGDNVTKVITMQFLLISKGYNMKADGDFGSRTEGNVKGFQTARGLKRDGIVGEATWLKLIETVQLHERSSAVKALQNELNQLPYIGYIQVDGDFGEQTKNAVIEFQRRNGLTVDGIVGPNTWLHLIGVTNPLVSHEVIHSILPS